jgi:hypothetical protein
MNGALFYELSAIQFTKVQNIRGKGKFNSFISN